MKVYDETRLKIDIGDYMLDESLKGEYVRQVMEDQSIPEEDKKIMVNLLNKRGEDNELYS